MSTTLTLLHADVVAARDGDRGAFERIVRATQGLVTSIAFAQVRDRELSEDVAQDALLTVWRKLPQLREASAFLPWLRELTRNLATSRQRAPAARAESLPLDDFDDLVAQATGPGELLDQAQSAQLLSALLDELDPELREPLLLFHREGESSQQVADLLGLSDAAVRKRLSRARSRLREGWLARVGQLAVVTAPGAGWSAALMTSLGAAAPAASAATVVGGGAKAFGFGASFAALPGVLGGLLGVAGGVRGELRGVDDPELRRAIIRTGWQMAGAVVIAAFGLALAQTPAHAIAAFAFLLLALAWLALWRMHVLRRERLRRAGQHNAAARAWLRRRFAFGLFGLVLGGVCGSLGLFVGGRAAGWW
jgi:RNA polymerase sigma factor (sigma-70 family)